jgi:excisionase family DNA binding protein
MLAFPTTHLAKTMTSSTAENAIMTIGEVADYLKVTERTIYRLAGAKQIPAFKVGGSWRFSKADIDGWIREQSTISQSATGISQD